jgi:3-dehydroquinate synthase
MTPTFALHGSPVFIGSWSDNFPQWLESQSYSSVFILADTHTATHCLPALRTQSALLCVIEPGEQQKNLHTCEKIWQQMMSAGLDRKALVVNLGGGVVGDMGGFCAATWKRGVDFVQAPTTLLSMTDAAIGGKTGIDFWGLKNAIGVFQQPKAVFIDPVFLKTLPERELCSGFAEVIKHALIGDPALWSRINNLSALPPGSDTAFWTEVLLDSVAVKVRVVTEDPHEKGLRMLLNFGHTIGHAVESYFLESPDPLTHGEAIAIGMECELYGDARQEMAATCLRRFFPQRHLPETAFARLWELMLQDKKNASGVVRMALPGSAPYQLQVVSPDAASVEQSLRAYHWGS